MNFELTEPGKQYSIKELLNDLYRVSTVMGGESVSRKKAVDQAGLEETKPSWGGELEETAIPEEKMAQRMVE
jgi:hypothetical protein